LLGSLAILEMFHKLQYVSLPLQQQTPQFQVKPVDLTLIIVINGLEPWLDHCSRRVDRGVAKPSEGK
jgi:hypothetical protein